MGSLVTTGTFSIIDVNDGVNGTNGTSVFVAALYQQSTTAPALPTNTTYNFSTNAVTGTLGSWTTAMPAGSTVPTYITTCTFTALAPATTQANSAWTVATIIAKNGVDGGQVTASSTPPASPTLGQQWWDTVSGSMYIWYNDGTTSQWVSSSLGLTGPMGATGDAVDIVFVRSASTPATPTTSTGVPTSPITWYTNVSGANAIGGLVLPLWSSAGFKASAGTNYVWDVPVRVDGTAVAEVTVYVRSATAPVAPTTGGTYTFNTPPTFVAPTAPIAWSTGIPAGTNPVYTSRAVVSTSSTNTAAVAITGWTTPVLSMQNGSNGSNGLPGATGPSALMTSNRQASFTATDGTLDATQTDIIFTTAVSNVLSPTYVWTFAGLTTDPTASTTSTQTITSAQFGTSKHALITCTVNSTYVDSITIVRLEKTTAAAGATVGANENNLAVNTTVSTGERMVITGRAIKIFDATGVKRVQLGDLSV